MLLKRFPKLFLQTSRFISDSVKRNASQNKLARRNLLFDETLEAKQINSLSEWKSIRRNHIINNKGNVTENNIDAVILEHCIRKNNYLLGSSYIDFLNQEEIKCSLAALGKYFKLFYLIHKEQCFYEGKKLSLEEEASIAQKFNSIKEEYRNLDSITLESSILALSLTKEWRQCFNLLGEVKVTTCPNSLSFSAAAAAAFMNKEESMAWTLLQEMIMLNKNIDDVVFHTYLHFLKKIKKENLFIFKLENLFRFIQENDLVLDSEKVIFKLSELGINRGLPSTVTFVSNDGVCRACTHQLDKFDLSASEFEELKSAIMKSVIIGKDVFGKTDHREMEKFQEFISENERFDVVLDGLNVGYSAGPKHSPLVFATIVASVVSHFAKKGKKVLVVGRYHMTKWPKDKWREINRESTVFLTQDLSKDDPYLLYCALNSGKDTIIVTKDLMRGHEFLLKKTKLKCLFRRWLTQRQYQLIRVGGTGTPIFKYPSPFTVTAQKNGGAWHVPFKNPTPSNPSNIGWLCMRM